MKWFRRILLLILAIIIIVSAVVILNGYKLYSSVLEELSLADKISQIKNDEDYVTLDEVNKDYVNAVIAVEDHRFKEHGAVDFISIARAIISNVKAGELHEGGSTITQQVAENLYFIGEDDVVSSKIAEVFMSMDLEKNYSKDEILEFYINIIYFGDGHYGIREASTGYYNKEPKDLNLYEATLLAGVPNAPSIYAPTINPDLAKNRQQKVISSMVRYGYLTQEQADNIKEDDTNI